MFTQLPLLPASILLLSWSAFLQVVHGADVSTVLVTATGPAGPAATSSQYTSDSEFQSSLLTAHNFFRDEHNASALAWNDTSAKYAVDWAQGCEFKHSGGPTGENLAAGYRNATAAVDAWANERVGYDFGKAQFSTETGHFTQVVWKATTSVGCGRIDCDGENGTPGWYVVCEYYPPGNVIGSFAVNVQSQVKGKNTDTVESGIGGAGALRIPWIESVAVLCGAVGVAVILW